MVKGIHKKVRILYTNGEDSYLLHALTHTGTDVYHGVPSAEKYTYHQSGVKHTKTQDGQYINRNQESPLPDVSFRQLICLGFCNSKSYFTNQENFQKVSNRKAHGTLIIDSRSMPENIEFNINIGLIAPNNLSMLYNMLNVHLIIPDINHRPQQVLLFTATLPWVYIILSHE